MTRQPINKAILIVLSLQQLFAAPPPLDVLSPFNVNSLICKTVDRTEITPFFLQPGSYRVNIAKEYPMTINYHTTETFVGYKLGVSSRVPENQLLKTVWKVTEKGQIQYTYDDDRKIKNIYLGGGVEQYKGNWMHVRLVQSENMAQEIVAWRDVNGKVYIQAKGSNYWLTKTIWNNDIVWAERLTARTSFELIPLDFLDKLNPIT